MLCFHVFNLMLYSHDIDQLSGQLTGSLGMASCHMATAGPFGLQVLKYPLLCT